MLRFRPVVEPMHVTLEITAEESQTVDAFMGSDWDDIPGLSAILLQLEIARAALHCHSCNSELHCCMNDKAY